MFVASNLTVTRVRSQCSDFRAISMALHRGTLLNVVRRREVHTKPFALVDLVDLECGRRHCKIAAGEAACNQIACSHWRF